MARITLDKLAHSYLPHPQGPDDYALKEIDTVWDDGGAYALLGPSGCGKTTMLNIISGLLTPSHGRVLYDGQDVTSLQPELRNIAQVFQFPVLYDTMTVFSNLEFPLKNRGVPKSERERRVKEIAEILDLTPFLNYRASNLAADAKQKISLGRGLVRSDVAAILFDEPLTVIDPHLKWQLRGKLKEIHKEFNLTMIYVTHDQVEAMTFADKIVVMYEGEIVQIGTPVELFERPEHTFVGYFIGSPGMNIMECTLDDGKAVTSGGAIEIPPQLYEAGKAKGGALKLGIRPMYLDVHTAEAPGLLEGRVTLLEDQGSGRLVTVQFGEHKLKAWISEEAALPQDRCWVEIPADRTLLFSDGKLVK